MQRTGAWSSRSHSPLKTLQAERGRATETTMDVIIVGAGIAGLTRALELDRVEIKARIYELVEEIMPLGWASICFHTRPRCSPNAVYSMHWRRPPSRRKRWLCCASTRSFLVLLLRLDGGLRHIIE